MKTPSSNSPLQRRTLLSLAVAMALSQYGAALAAPLGHQLVTGKVTVTRPDPLQTVISQTSQSAIVNWQQFSIGATEHVDIRQPNASSVLLNRVIGNNPTEIYGRLSANGKVFLVNPNGVLFGRTAQVSVGGLVASTLDIVNDDFLAGRYKFSGNSGALVENQGTISAAAHGTVALLGGRINNDGTIVAQLGTAALAAGEKITLDFEGDGLTRIRVDQGAVAAQVANRGLIIADGGQAIMSAQAAQALADTVLNQQGVIRARSLVERDGKIMLDGGAHGVTLNSGTLDASGGAGQKGGTISVLGRHVGLVGTAALDASGGTGGGDIFVGGGVQGGNPLLRNAAATFAGKQTSLRADALGKGKGGTVVLWSDDATRMYGTASARGGSLGGDGGFIETSGHFLDVAGAHIDAAAPHGKAGNWLLDPYDLTIADAFDVPSTMGTSPNFVSDATSSELRTDAIEAALDAGSNVTVTTGAGSFQDGNIYIDGDIIKNGDGDVSLTFNAASSIFMQAVQIGSNNGKLDVNMNADADSSGGGVIRIPQGALIRTNGGAVRLYGQGDPVNGFASSTDVEGPSGVVIDAATINTTAALPTDPGGDILIRGHGNVDSSGSGIELNGSILTSGGAIVLTGIGGASGDGVTMFSPQLSTTAGGSIDIRGLSPADPFSSFFGSGIYADDAVITTAGGPGNITLSGESFGGVGLVLGGVRLGDSGTSGDISLRAFNSDVGGFQPGMLDLPSVVETTGVFALRPGGVSDSGALTSKDNVTINIGNFFSSTPPAGQFAVNDLILGSIIEPAVSGVVFGSNTHTGQILVSTPVTFDGAFDLTLQNGGAGSAGIALTSALANPGATITLSSGGSVTQSGPITANGLLLNGTQTSSVFTLNDNANAVDVFSARFDQAGGGAASFFNGQALTMGPLTGSGFDSVTNLRQTIDASKTTATGDLTVQAVGDLSVAQNVDMLGASTSLILRSDNDLIVNGPLGTNGSAALIELEAGRDVSLNGAIVIGGALSDLVVLAVRNVIATSSISMLGSDSAANIDADTQLNLGGNITLQGDRSVLTLNTINGNLQAASDISVSGADSALNVNASNTLTSSGAITLAGANNALQLNTTTGNLTLSGAVSLSGSNGQLTVNAGQDALISASVSTAGGANVQRINARHDIVLTAGASFFAAGPLNLDLNADSDNLNNGGITMTGANIATSGGALRLYGQGDAAAGSASGTGFARADGIALTSSTINTGSGALTMRGRGTTPFVTGGTQPGIGVKMALSTIGSTTGAVAISGQGGNGGDGVALVTSTVATSAGGAIDIRGRSGPIQAGATVPSGSGLSSSASTIQSSGGAGNIVLSGESIGGSGILLSGTNVLGGAATTGNVVLRASNTASTAQMLALGGTIQTSGVINMRPGGVSATGALTEQPGTAISLGATTTAGQFNLSAAALNAAILPGARGVVIGSAAHSGAITTSLSAPLSGLYDLTLQNGAAGSGGISLLGGLSNPGAMLTLSSGATVSQTGPLVVGRLLLHGTQPQSNFQLINAGNAVGTVSALFLQPKGAGASDGDVNFYTGGDLQLGALTGAGFDSATNLAQTFSSTASTGIAGDLTLGAGNDINLAGAVSMLASDAVVTLNAGRDINLGAALGKATATGALQININADADGVNGGAFVMAPAASLASNGGAINIYGQSDAAAGYASGSATSAGGVVLSGSVNAAGAGGTGAISVRGRGVAGAGISVNGATVTGGSALTTLTGMGGAGATGVLISAAQVSTTGGGGIDIRGRAGSDITGSTGNGVTASASTIRTGGGAGELDISGEAFGGAGIALTGASVLGGTGSSGNILLRAANSAAAPTLVGGGTLQTSGVVNIRAAGVSAAGVLTDAPGTVINIGSPATAGTVSMAQDLFVSGIAAGTPSVIVGSAAQTGAINVLANAPLGGTYELSLQNDGVGSGGINLYQGLSIPGRMLTLSSGGSVTQGGAIVAGRLMLHGTRPQSSFQLVNTGNAVSRMSSRFEVLKGPAATDGDVNFYSGGNLEIGPLTGTGFDSTSGQTQPFVAANAVIAGDIVAQAGGNLTLLQNVSTLGSDITLVTGGVLLNPANATLNPGGGGRWRVFADTWLGEVDGGLTGTAPTPNFYNCLFGAACNGLLPATNNYFVYRQQPVLNVVLNTPAQTRPYGVANPVFPFTASGLVNGDSLAASLTGTYTVPTATNVGSYAVPGAFTSPVGYLVNAVPGTLTVTPMTLTFTADPASRPSNRPNPPLTGTLTGFVNGETAAGATTGTISFTSSAPLFATPGQYPINGAGLNATNYVFQQAAGNLTALTVTRASVLLPSIISQVSMPSSDLYGANFGVQRSCVGSGPLSGASGAGDANDSLAMEWSRVRETPNLSNCVGLAQRYSCGDF
jgi:filamentous hemagglutinin family protein